MNLHAKLQDGVLALDPVQFEMPQGRLSGAINIDAREDFRWCAWMCGRPISICDQLKGAGPGSAAPLAGVMQARAVIEGRGIRVHNLMADADGSFAAVIPHGDIRAAFAELTGIDLSGLGLLLTK